MIKPVRKFARKGLLWCIAAMVLTVAVAALFDGAKAQTQFLTPGFNIPAPVTPPPPGPHAFAAKINATEMGRMATQFWREVAMPESFVFSVLW